MPDSVYGPARNFAEGTLPRFGIETTFYDPEIDADGIGALFRQNTTVLYTESPGSHTFEVQDIPALARAAHARGAKVLMDNTWGIHFLPAVHAWRGRLHPGADEIPRRPFRPAHRQHHRQQRGRLGSPARHVARSRPIRQPRRLLARLRGVRTLGVRLAAPDGRRDRSGALDAQTSRSARSPASCSARRPWARNLEARLHRRLQPVRRGVQTGLRRGRNLAFCRSAGAVRHRRLLGRL